MHGYDVIDPTQVNPGTRRRRRACASLVAALRGAGLGLIVDIVPNHMAAGGMENPWWADVLRHGRDSRYATFLRHRLGQSDATARCSRRSSASRTARRCATARSRWRAIDGEPVIRYYDNRVPDPPGGSCRDRRGTAGRVRSGDARRAGERLHRLLERQHYRLAWWRSAGDAINWRRFFDINGLVGTAHRGRGGVRGDARDAAPAVPARG